MSIPVSNWIAGGTGGSWFTAANWRHGMPAAGTRAVFNRGHAETVNLAPPLGGVVGGNPASAGEVLAIGDTVTFTDGTLLLAPPVSVNGLPMALQISGGGGVIVAANASIVAQGEVLVGNGTTGGSLTIDGVFSDTVGGIAGPAPSSISVLGDKAHWTNSSDLFVSAGSLTIAAGATVDGGPLALTTGYASVEIGTPNGQGAATVKGHGSLLTATAIFVGDGDAGSLSILGGAHVVDEVGAAGGLGDGSVLVSGAGSLWQNLYGLRVGENVPETSSLTVIRHGSVVVDGQLDLSGTLALDSTATLQATSIISLGGIVRALANGPGTGETVTIGESLYIGDNPMAPFQLQTTYLSAAHGTVLDLAGSIQAVEANTVLMAGAGHIELSSTANALPAIHLLDATLELAVTGAAGSAAIGFIGSAGTLQIDAGVALPSPISGFAARDAFDLRGVNFAADLIPGWTPLSVGGVLSVSDGINTETLTLLGSYSAVNFHLASDGHNGTLVTFVRTG